MKNSQPKALGQNSLCYPASPARRGGNAAHASISLDKTSTNQIVTRSPLNDGRCLSRPPARSSSRNGPTHHRRPELSHEAHPDHLWGVADDGALCIRNAASYFVADTKWNIRMAEGIVKKLPENFQRFALGAKRICRSSRTSQGRSSPATSWRSLGEGDWPPPNLS